MTDPFILDNTDLQNPLWGRIKAHLLGRQESMLRKLSRYDLSEIETTMTRGELKFLKHMLGIDPAERTRPDVSDTVSERR